LDEPFLFHTIYPLQQSLISIFSKSLQHVCIFAFHLFSSVGMASKLAQLRPNKNHTIQGVNLKNSNYFKQFTHINKHII